MDARSTPIINSDFSSHKNTETSISSEDLLTSSEHLFSAHDTIDLSPDMKQTDKDYVRISKQEYEEIKSRVSAIENRLSREFTDVIPRVQPLQQVQNVYEQTLEEVAMLNCPTSDHLARRLSKELKIRPNEEAKIIRSPSARKIGSIRRRSKENITKIVRHKSWNASTQSQASQNSDRFYPFLGLRRRERTSTAKSDLAVAKVKQPSVSEWDGSTEDHNVSDTGNQKYNLRKRVSLASPYNLDKTIGKIQSRRSLNINMSTNSWNNTVSEHSMSNTINSSSKSNNSDLDHTYQNIIKKSNKYSRQSPQQSQQKWRNAAAFFMDKTGEAESVGHSGRPSVNKLRRQNAGAVLAKAKLFESSSDKSSEANDRVVHTGFARRPRVNIQQQVRPQKLVAHVRPKVQVSSEDMAARVPVKLNSNMADIANSVPSRSYRPNVQVKDDVDTWRMYRRTSPMKKVVSPQSNQNFLRNTQAPALKKPLSTLRSLRTPIVSNEPRKANTPMKAVHVTSPRRRSPRQKPRFNN